MEAHAYMTEEERLMRAAERAAELFEIIWPHIDWSDDHFVDTPARFAQMLMEVTTPQDIKWKTFPSKNDEMIVVKDIPFATLCAHHVVPVTGLAHVGYVPSEQLVGLSKIARVVKWFAAGLTIQEQMTDDIAHYLVRFLEPKGVAVVMEAEHMCMSLRGVQVHGTKTTTSSMLGVYGDHDRLARTEFLNLINNGRH
jgi:GTP cyclohydrolase I